MANAKSKQKDAVEAVASKAVAVAATGDTVPPQATTAPTLAQFQQVQQDLEAVFNRLWEKREQSKTLSDQEKEEYWIARSAAFEAMETAQVKTLTMLNIEGAKVFANVVTATADLKKQVKQAQDVVAIIKVVTASLSVLTSFWSLFSP